MSGCRTCRLRVYLSRRPREAVRVWSGSKVKPRERAAMAELPTGAGERFAFNMQKAAQLTGRETSIVTGCLARDMITRSLSVQVRSVEFEMTYSVFKRLEVELSVQFVWEKRAGLIRIDTGWNEWCWFRGIYPLREGVAAGDQGFIPTCRLCGAPASCVGRFELPLENEEFACDDCCGHGNEDGRCAPVRRSPGAEVLALEVMFAGDSGR